MSLMNDGSDVSFESASFAPAYTAVPKPEFPPDGKWRHPVYHFGRSGDLITEPETRWGAPLVAQIEPDSTSEWVGMFASGGLGGITGLFACPSPMQLLVLVDGEAYLVDVAAPADGATVAHDQVSQVTSVGTELLVLVRMIDMVAIDASGVRWRSSRLAVDDLRVDEASAERIICSCDLLLDERAVVVIDPNTGEQLDGPRLDSFWPPDALA